MAKSALLGMMIAFTLLASPNVHAQQDMQAKKYDNPEWKRIVMIRFKPDKSERAEEIINDYYLKACVKSGTPLPTTLLDIKTGEWDMLLVWDMKEGLEEMNWETSPKDIAWKKALEEIAGSASKANAVLDEFSSLIDRQVTYIGKPEKP